MHKFHDIVDMSIIEPSTICLTALTGVEKRVDKVEQLYNTLKETFLLLDDGDRHLLNEYNLSPSRFFAMVHISEKPGLSSSELSDRLLCDKSNVTRIVRGLEQQGFIERHPHETDGRTLRLYLTTKGLETCTQIQIQLKHYNETRLNNLGSLTQEHLLETLAALNKALQTDLAAKQISHNGNTPWKSKGKGGDAFQSHQHHLKFRLANRSPR